MPAHTVHIRGPAVLKIPGYEFRRLKQFADEEIWKAFAKEVED